MTLLRFLKLFQRSTREFPAYLEKQGSDFSEIEGVNTGTRWIDGRTIFRKAVDFNGLPNAGAKSVAHGITDIFSVVQMWGQASNAVAGTSWNVPNNFGPVRLTVDSTNITLVTISDLSSFDDGFVIIDYVLGQPL